MFTLSRDLDKEVGLDEAVVRASISDDRNLVNHFLTQSDEADRGCESRHVLLTLLGAIIGENQDIVENIKEECKPNKSIIDIVESVARRNRITVAQYQELVDNVLNLAASNNIYTILDCLLSDNVVIPNPELGLDEGDAELESISKLASRVLESRNYAMYDYLMNLYKKKSGDDIKLDLLKDYIREKKMDEDFINSASTYYKLSPDQLS